MPDDKQKVKLLYNAVVHFPTFMDHYKTMPSIKDKLKPIQFENYQPQFLQNTELYKAETLVEDFNHILRSFPAEPKSVTAINPSLVDPTTGEMIDQSGSQAPGTPGRVPQSGNTLHPETMANGGPSQIPTFGPAGMLAHPAMMSGKIPVYNIPVSALLPAIMLPAPTPIEELVHKLEPFLVFVNMFLFKRKFQLSLPIIQDDKFCDVLLQLLDRIIKYMPFKVLKTYCILLTFFNNLFPSFDKKVLQVLSDLPREILLKLSHSDLRKLGIIFLSHNMPRSSSFFFYTPKKEAKKIKFFTYFDSCKRLAALKTNRRGPNAAMPQNQSANSSFIDELHKIVLVFASLKEFKFSHEYLKLQAEIHHDLFGVFAHLVEADRLAQVAIAAEHESYYLRGGAEGAAKNVQSKIGSLEGVGRTDEESEFAIPEHQPSDAMVPEKTESQPAVSFWDRFERLQSSVIKLTHLAEHYLEEDSLSRSSLLAYAKFLSLVLRFLECFETFDLPGLKKTKLHMQEFLALKGSGLFSSDLHYYFKVRKIIGILESGTERSPLSELKMAALKYINDIDLLMLPRAVFISHRTPKLHANQGLLWQFRDKHKVTSLQEHVVECEIEVQNLPSGSHNSESGKHTSLQSSSVLSGGPSAGWVVEAEITCSETVFNQVRFTKKAIKTAHNLLSFSFLLHFDTACPYKLVLSAKLLNRAGFLIDQIHLEDNLDVI